MSLLYLSALIYCTLTVRTWWIANLMHCEMATTQSGFILYWFQVQGKKNMRSQLVPENVCYVVSLILPSLPATHVNYYTSTLCGAPCGKYIRTVHHPPCCSIFLFFPYSTRLKVAWSFSRCFKLFSFSYQFGSCVGHLFSSPFGAADNCMGQRVYTGPSDNATESETESCSVALVNVFWLLASFTVDGVWLENNSSMKICSFGRKAEVGFLPLY